MRKNSTKNLVLAGLFIALGVIRSSPGKLELTGVTAHAYSGTDKWFVCGWPMVWQVGLVTPFQQLYDRNAAHTHGYDNDL